MKHAPAPLRASRRAFTLIEILVVIAIIGILSAILFPVFSRARENGRKTACLSNLKQLGTAFLLYQQDSRGKLPQAGQYQKWADGGHWITGGMGGTAQNFTDAQMGLADPTTFATVPNHEAYPENSRSALSSYIKSPGSFVCPSAPDGQQKRLSYSMNCALAGLAASRITSPGDIVLLVDEGKTINDGYFWATNNGSSTDALFGGHNGGGNLLYADGHVKFMVTEAVPTDFKTRLQGSPRFHDRAFGSGTGSSLQPPTVPPQANDSCGRPITDVPAAPVPTPTAGP